MTKLDDVYRDCMAQEWAHSGVTWRREVARIYAKYIQPQLGDKKVESISKDVVRRWFADRLATGANIQANRSLSVLSKLFSFYNEFALVPVASPYTYIRKAKETHRRRFATTEEIKKINELLEQNAEKYPEKVAFIYILMFTGSRPRAIEKANRDQLRFETDDAGNRYGRLTFWGKSGVEEVILPTRVLKYLEVVWAKHPLDLSLTSTKMPHDFWDKIRTQANCPDLWIRDWRRTFASIALSSGESLGVVGELLNHRSAQTTKIYAHLIGDERVKATRRIADKIGELL